MRGSASMGALSRTTRTPHSEPARRARTSYSHSSPSKSVPRNRSRKNGQSLSHLNYRQHKQIPEVNSSQLPPVGRNSSALNTKNLESIERPEVPSAMSASPQPGCQLETPQSAEPTSAWDRAAMPFEGSRDALIQAAHEEWKASSFKEYREAMTKALASWNSKGDMNDCDAALTDALKLCPESDMLHRFRSSVRLRNGMLDDALIDAGNAVVASPGNPRNHLALAVANQRKEHLNLAGAAYITSMRRGMHGTSDKLGFTGYLNTVRRSRNYFAEVRPPYRKSVSQLSLARTPSRTSIFDPQKNMGYEMQAEEELEVPDPPQLRLVKADMNSVTVEWLPTMITETASITIYAYELQMAQHDVVWQGDSFFDGYR